VKLAEAYGLEGYHVSNIRDFEAAFSAAVASGRACVIDCAIDIDEMVHPMVPGGKPITDFLLD
jgi:acetolactate synthase-1/2/3 large subunit